MQTVSLFFYYHFLGMEPFTHPLDKIKENLDNYIAEEEPLLTTVRHFITVSVYMIPFGIVAILLLLLQSIKDDDTFFSQCDAFFERISRKLISLTRLTIRSASSSTHGVSCCCCHAAFAPWSHLVRSGSARAAP